MGSPGIPQEHGPCLSRHSDALVLLLPPGSLCRGELVVVPQLGFGFSGGPRPALILPLPKVLLVALVGSVAHLQRACIPMQDEVLRSSRQAHANQSSVFDQSAVYAGSD